MRRITLTILLFLLATAAFAADPPELLNYQGVLRNASDAPREGTHDMVFVFYSAQGGGDEILVDRHTGDHSMPVTVSGGLFNVDLGGGAVSDGVGPGIYNTLSEMFRDYGDVWMAIQVNGETLSPRVRVLSSAYAFNAAHLGGKKATEYIDTSGLSQVKNGDLTVNNLTSNGGYIYLNNGGQIRNMPGYMELKNDLDTDTLYLKGGNSASDGQVVIFGQSYMELKAGTGEFRFFRGNSGAEVANLSGVGNLQLDGGLTAEGMYSYFGPSATLVSGDTVTSIYNNEDTDVLRLVGGDTMDDGNIEIYGDLEMNLRAGNGLFRFYSGATGLERAALFGDGDLQIDGELDADGYYHRFGTNATLYSGSTVTALYNDNDTDWLRLVAGYNLANSSYIELKGDSEIEFRAGNGNFEFVNVGTSTETARINNYGDLQLDGYLDDDGIINFVNNATITVNSSPATLTFAGSNMELGLGDSSLDNVNVPGNLYVSGTKDFVQNHPYRNDLAVHYTALEGGESATYTRGSARLEDGVAVVLLDESFAWVTNPDVGLTAHATPRGQAASLWVESVSTTELTVRCDEVYCDEAAFDYIVTGLRIGYEDYPVVQRRTIDAPVPPAGYYVPRKVGDHPMKAHSGLGRFPQAKLDTPRAASLREAIGMHSFEEIASAKTPRELMEDREPDGAPEAVAPDSAPVAQVADTVDPSPDDSGEIGPTPHRVGQPVLATAVSVSEPVEAGSILAIDPDNPASLRLADTAYDTTVFGVVTDDPGVMLTAMNEGEVAVAVSGVTLCKADAGYGAILPGDLLVSSPTPGHAMRAVEPEPGTVIGKALEPLDAGAGHVRMLVMMR